MHRIDEEGATPQNGFTDGDVQMGVPATTLGDDWLNAVQEEISNVIEAAGIVLDKANNGQLLQALGGRGSGGMKNLLINGDFSLFQRNPVGGGSPQINAVPAYTVDRWVGSADGPGGLAVGSVFRTPIPPADSRIGSPQNKDAANASWKLRISIGGTSTVDGLTVEQRFEDLVGLAGEALTFSIYVETEIGFAITGRLEIVQHFGDGGLASPEVLVATKNISPGSETYFRRFVVSGTCPNISGKTFDGTPSIRVRYREDVGFGAHDTFLALAQLERSSSPSPFDYRPASIELLLARRYFEKSAEPNQDIDSANLKGISAAYVPAGVIPVGLGERFLVEKRVTPTMLWYDHNGSAGQITWGSTKIVIGSDSSLSRVSTGNPIVSVASLLGTARGHWTADAEI